jgi:phosphatidylserine/phosphatidylglycerophosphate/cardiolipin synthase-like enzyme
MLTETKIQEALVKAKNTNKIEIKIILEKNPYLATSINNKAYNFLIENNIDIIRSNPDNYTLNHSKLLIIDEKAIIST